MNDLPEILTAKHIATYLGLSLRRVYELFQTNQKSGGIRNFDIGNSKRVGKGKKQSKLISVGLFVKMLIN